MPYNPSEFIRFAMSHGIMPSQSDCDRVVFTINVNTAYPIILKEACNTGVLPPSMVVNENHEITTICDSYDRCDHMYKWLWVCFVSQRIKKMTGRTPIIPMVFEYDEATREYDSIDGCRSSILSLFTRLGQDMLTTPIETAMLMFQTAWSHICDLSEDRARTLLQHADDTRRKSNMGMIQSRNEESILCELLDMMAAK